MDVMSDVNSMPASTDVLVVGAGPAGSSAAAWAAASGRSVLLADSAVFPRDKTCGDGLTPRAVAELDLLGLGDWVRARSISKGLRMCGWGKSAELQWPKGSFPVVGSAVPRTELDDRIRLNAVERGAVMAQSAKAVSVESTDNRVTSVTFKTADGLRTVSCRTLVVADGVKSTLGKQLGREWHQDLPYAVAARAYIKSGRSDDPFITGHMEIKDPAGGFVPGYGWIFPLGNGEVNVGLGSISTKKRPARVALHPLLEQYAEEQRKEWDFVGEVRALRSALLPMAGSVSNFAGKNWACIGDAAACINPLNGEGIDYGLEGGRLLAAMLDEPDLTQAWPNELRTHYGSAFSIGRRVVALGTQPGVFRVGGPLALRSRRFLNVLLRTMGNLITEEDKDLVARMWRTAGRVSMRLDQRPPFS
ncbi:geranylgeranyl reductase family protein [Smaragdicoccus niigatensis]|uniref:geranylgeranyl reductase family protein n=1 Tax=Smaragdicoccus niigatensis TaxID=359359 RepID=UPI00035E72D3